MAGVSFLKRGADAAKLEQQRNAEIETQKAERGKLWRFFIGKGEEARITFVDGNLNDQGVLDQPRLYEHNLFWNGNWNNHFLCMAKTHPGEGHVCPLCEQGNKPSLVALFTIIDHRVTKSKDGTKTYKDQTRLFAAKPATYEYLQKLAGKRDGLAGATFDAMRTKDDKSPAVGNIFDFVEKNDPAELAKKYTFTYEVDGKTQSDTRYKVADYDAQVTVKTEEEMRALGFGGGANSITPPSANTNTGHDYTENL